MVHSRVEVKATQMSPVSSLYGWGLGFKGTMMSCFNSARSPVKPRRVACALRKDTLEQSKIPLLHWRSRRNERRHLHQLLCDREHHRRDRRNGQDAGRAESSDEVLTALGSAFKAGANYPILTWMTESGAPEQPKECKHTNTETSYTSKHDGTHTVTVTCNVCHAVVSTTSESCSPADGKCTKCSYCPHAHTETTCTPNDDGTTHTVTVTCTDCNEKVSETDDVACTKGEDGHCVCGRDLSAWPETDTDGYLKIATEANLKWFRDQVNDGKTNLKARLINDIALTESWTPIGTSESHFVGSFDGNGKTISGLSIVHNTPTARVMSGSACSATSAARPTAPLRSTT